MPRVETERILLQMFTPEHLEDLHCLLTDPEVVRYVGTGKPVSREETETALMSFGKHWARHGFGRWAAIEKNTGNFMGFGGLRLLIDTPEVVYHLATAYWGLGMATEMASASLRYGFEEHKFDRIVAVAMPENKASIHVMEKVGMAYEKNTNYYEIDVIQYSISRENYQPDDSLYLLD